MNNYSSPLMIRVLNSLDTIFGLCIIYIVVLGGAMIKPNVQSPFMIIQCIICGIYALICITKSIAYIMCIFQGYRVTTVGMIIYIVWTILVSLCVAIFIINIIMANLELAI